VVNPTPCSPIALLADRVGRVVHPTPCSPIALLADRVGHVVNPTPCSPIALLANRVGHVVNPTPCSPIALHRTSIPHNQTQPIRYRPLMQIRPLDLYSCNPHIFWRAQKPLQRPIIKKALHPPHRINRWSNPMLLRHPNPQWNTQQPMWKQPQIPMYPIHPTCRSARRQQHPNGPILPLKENI
jgi:hypothetical protein